MGAIRSITEPSPGGAVPLEALPVDSQGKVVLYCTAWCGHCKRAEAYMKDKGVAFVQKDIEMNPGYNQEYKRLGGKGGVPYFLFVPKG